MYRSRDFRGNKLIVVREYPSCNFQQLGSILLLSFYLLALSTEEKHGNHLRLHPCVPIS